MRHTIIGENQGWRAVDAGHQFYEDTDVRRIALGVLGLVVIAGVITTLAGRSASPGPTYTVAQAQAAITQHPRA